METPNKGGGTAVVVIVLLALGVTAYFVVKAMSKPKTPPTRPAVGSPSAPATTPSAITSSPTDMAIRSNLPAGSFPINAGDTNQFVYDIQWSLVNLYGLSLPTYGINGTMTQETVGALDSAGFTPPLSQADYDAITSSN